MFKKKLSPEEQLKQWRSSLRSEIRGMEREIRILERTELKTKTDIKNLAKNNQLDSAKMLAKEIIGIRKGKERLFIAKVQINSVILKLQENMAMAKVSKALGKSTEVMQIMNNLINVPQMSKTMRAMAMEMEKAGLIEEMIEDTFDNEEGIEEEADEQVQSIIDEIVLGKLGQTNVPTNEREKEDQLDELEEFQKKKNMVTRLFDNF